MRNILIITYYWPPSGGSGVQRWLKFAKYLPQYGWRPIVLTVNENKASYPQIDKSLETDISKDLQVYKTNTFEILSLYKKISPEKEIPFGGFTDERKPTIFEKISRFIRGNFFLPDPRRGWNKYAYKKACEIIKKENIQFVVTTSPPHSTQLIGLKLKRKFKSINWIADLRDPWTDIHYYGKLYPTKIATILNRNYERNVLETADKIVVTCKSTRTVFLKKTKKDIFNKFEIITNGFDTDDFTGLKNNTINQFTITYIGILYNTLDIEGLLSALESIDNKTDLSIQFVGHSGKTIEPEIKRRELKNYTKILPQLKHAEAIQKMADSSLLVLLLPNNSNDSAFIPGKLFEYLAVRRPILCIASPNSDVKKIIENCNAGKVFNYDDIDGMSSYINETMVQWKKNKITEIDDNTYLKYSRKSLTNELDRILRTI